MHAVSLLVPLFLSSFLLPRCRSQVVDKTLYENGKKLSHFYNQLHELPVPGKSGSFFQYFQFTQAYRSSDQLGCVFDGAFYKLNETVEQKCSVLQCLPNTQNNVTGAFIQKTLDCGPPGPNMVRHLCHYKNTSEPHTSKFPQCCPQFDCIDGYDPRRLILPPDSPIQARKFSEVDRGATLRTGPLEDTPNTQPRVLDFEPFPSRSSYRERVIKAEELPLNSSKLNEDGVRKPDRSRNRFRKRGGISILDKILGRGR